jgi:4-phosphopantoate--beta-alanine ligase
MDKVFFHPFFSFFFQRRYIKLGSIVMLIIVIPKSHPRYTSLKTRELLSRGMQQGLVHETGLIAHGRGEAFDYLLGEQTIPPAFEAEKIAAAVLLVAQNPVISVNGNVAVFVGEECIQLAQTIPAKLEVNLFHRTPKRMHLIIHHLKKKGAHHIYGSRGDARIPGLAHDRARCDVEGIFNADVVLVPLEDGDRCQALLRMGKTVIAIDLNPLSRTAKTSSITIVDNVVRALPNIKTFVKRYRHKKKSTLQKLIQEWDNAANLQKTVTFMSKRLDSVF